MARQQFTDVGATVVNAEVTSIEAKDGPSRPPQHFGATRASDYVILAGGKASQRLANDFGIEVQDWHTPPEHDDEQPNP